MAAKPQSGPRGQLDKTRAEAYWKRNVGVIRTMLIIWALVSYVAGILLAPLLKDIMIGQIPLGFWFAQQGSIIIFVILIFAYCFIMDAVDKEFDVNE
jgi:putative solute:sodium symporter small subunit